MKRLLLIALMAGGMAFVPAQRSDAQVSVGIGFGYPSYGYRYYPYGYAITRTDTIDHIDTMVITRALRTIGLTGTEFTATIVITITTIATNLT
jgi:hypothetical protein